MLRFPVSKFYFSDICGALLKFWQNTFRVHFFFLIDLRLKKIDIFYSIFIKGNIFVREVVGSELKKKNPP